MKKIYYLTVEGISSSVFESQVHSLKKEFSKDKNLDFNLFIGQLIKSRIPIKKFFNLFFDKKVRFFFLNKGFDYVKSAKKIAKKIYSNDAILHCRNIEAAYIGLIIKQKILPNINIIYDVRGYVEGEMLFFKRETKFKIFKELNDALFSVDNGIYYNFVSKDLYDLYNKKYNIPKDRVIFCNSGFNDAVFKFISSESDTSKETKIIYIGGNQSYQNINKIEQLFSKMDGVSLTIVTSKPIKVKKEGVTYYHNLTQKELSKLTGSFDYGVIYRSNHDFNKIATPTKVTEYWGKGLKVIAIGNAGAYTKDIINNPLLGLVVQNTDELNIMNLSKLTLKEKEKISLFAKNTYSLSVNLKKYTDLYNQISNNENN